MSQSNIEQALDMIELLCELLDDGEDHFNDCSTHYWMNRECDCGKQQTLIRAKEFIERNLK